MLNHNRTRMMTVTETLRGIGRFLRKVRDWSTGDDLYEAQMHRSDDHEFRVNPGGGLGF